MAQHGLITPKENKLLIDTVNQVVPHVYKPVFVELGVKNAGSTRVVLDVLEILHCDSAEVYGVDIHPVKNWPGDKDKLLKMNSWEAASLFKDDSVAWCFVDACHRYGPVNKDIKAWARKITSRGFMLFHDSGLWWTLMQQGRGEVLKAVVDNAGYLYRYGFRPYWELPGFFPNMAYGRDEWKDGPRIFDPKEATPGLLALRKE